MWYDSPLPRRAPTGGLTEPLNGHTYKGGELLPFYVPRPLMPQIDESDYPALFAFLQGKGIAVETVTLETATLKQHQRVDSFNPAAMPVDVLAKPVLISADYFVLDGNHRYVAHLHLGLETINCIRLDGLSFEDAIAALFSFPNTYTVDGNVNRN
jgi:uncharacterized ParB-like nuclease family protein